MSIKPEERLSAQSIMIDEINGFSVAVALKEQAAQKYNEGDEASASMKLPLNRSVKKKFDDHHYEDRVNQALKAHFKDDPEIKEVAVHLAFPNHVKMKVILNTPAIP